MLILISNDDGIQSPGIRALTRSLKNIPKVKVVVVAPDREKSAASHALTLHRPLRIDKIGPGWYSVDGTPTDAVTLGVHTVLGKKPDLIVSGINRGANLGEDVHYSGTVAAAVEGAIMGVPSVAISVVGHGQYNFTMASKFAQKLVRQVLAKGLPHGVVLNVNVPNLPAHKIEDYEITKLGKHNYGDVIVEHKDPRGRACYWIGGVQNQFEDRVGSDCNAYVKNKISITPLKVDMTDHHFIKELKKWKL